MMWQNFDGKPYSREAFINLVNGIPPSTMRWVRFITLHNTAGPTIKQWLSSVATPAQRIINLEGYYENTLGWHAGPHGFIPPNKEVCIYGFTNLNVQGVHASCFNRVSIGLEMVGDFDSEEFDSGPGALVQDNAIFVLAVLHLKLGLRPDGYAYGESGLHFHVECRRDNHDCPGRKVLKPKVVAAVLARMEQLKGGAPTVPAAVAPPPAPLAPPSPPAAQPAQNERHSVIMTEFGGSNDPQDSAYGLGRVNGGLPGFALPYRWREKDGPRPGVRVFYKGKAAQGPIVDVGPIYIDDPYWLKPGAIPRAERAGVASAAGLDATPAVWDTLGVTGPERGRCRVEWEFLK